MRIDGEIEREREREEIIYKLYKLGRNSKHLSNMYSPGWVSSVCYCILAINKYLVLFPRAE
jgi:hypothetical protein